MTERVLAAMLAAQQRWLALPEAEKAKVRELVASVPGRLARTMIDFEHPDNHDGRCFMFEAPEGSTP